VIETARTAITLLQAGAGTLRIELSAKQQSAFVRYCDLLVSANERVNLTGVRDPVGIMTTLFLDSLTIGLAVPSMETRIGRMVDVGSGAGIPGIPLKIVHPTWELLAIESVGKKARFVAEVARDLGLEGVTVLSERAESVARQPRWRDCADLAVARAVAPVGSLIELCGPFVLPGGFLVFPKSGAIEEELRQARGAERAFGLGPPEIVAVPGTLDLPVGLTLIHLSEPTRPLSIS
jgi:16S rRNA (guanine527-N7)-methyltransferase